MSLINAVKALYGVVRKGGLGRRPFGLKRLAVRKRMVPTKTTLRTYNNTKQNLKYTKKNKIVRSSGLQDAKDPSYSVKKTNGPNRLVSKAHMSYIKDQLIPVKDFLIRKKEFMDTPIGRCQFYWVPLGSAQDIIDIFGQLTSSDPNQKFDITDSKLVLKCQNMGTCAAYMTVYTCVARHDIPSSLTSMDAMLASGFGEFKTDAEITSVTVGSTIFQNTTWVNYFNVIASKDIKLDLAESVTLDIHDPKNKLINYKLIDDASPLGLTGYTQGFVIQINGQMAASTTVPNYEPTTTGVKLSTLAERHYSVKQSQDSLVKGTFLLGDTLDEEDNVTFINKATGVVVNQVFA